MENMFVIAIELCNQLAIAFFECFQTNGTILWLISFLLFELFGILLKEKLSSWNFLHLLRLHKSMSSSQYH
jgi:hypothetical protein